MIPDTIRPAISRIVGALAAALVVTLMRYFGKDLSPDLQSAVSDIGVFVAFTAYASIHKWISTKTNPTDSASPSLSQVARPPEASPEALAEHMEQAAEQTPKNEGASGRRD